MIKQDLGQVLTLYTTLKFDVKDELGWWNCSVSVVMYSCMNLMYVERVCVSAACPYGNSTVGMNNPSSTVIEQSLEGFIFCL